MGLFGDFQKTTTVILTKFDDEMFALDLKFAQGEGLFHMDKVKT